MKTAHTFSFLRTTSDIFASSLSQPKASATFVFRHLSLLLASRRRELLLDWTIGDATPGSTCMFPGTLPRRLHSQCVFPHPSDNGFIRDTSPCFARSLDVARTFFWIYNPRKPAIIIIPHLEPARLTHSARFSRISKSLSYPQDSFESARLPRISPTPELDRFTPRLLFHRATALHSSP